MTDSNKHYMAYNHNHVPLLVRPTQRRQEAENEAEDYRAVTGNSAYVGTVDPDDYDLDSQDS